MPVVINFANIRQEGADLLHADGWIRRIPEAIYASYASFNWRPSSVCFYNINTIRPFPNERKVALHSDLWLNKYCVSSDEEITPPASGVHFRKKQQTRVQCRPRTLALWRQPTRINPLTQEINRSAKRCLTRFLLGILLLELCISLIYAW
jgi:hypothetical protein